MRFRFARRAVASLVALASVTSCAGNNPAHAKSVDGTVAPSQGLVLQIDEGERRVRRTAGKGPFILKVDRQNGGSPDLVMGTKTLHPARRFSCTDTSSRMKSSSCIAAQEW